VGFVVEKVALGQVFPRVLQFSPVNFIPPVKEIKKLIIFLFIFITGLHNKPQSCGTSVASAAGPFSTKKNEGIHAQEHMEVTTEDLRACPCKNCITFPYISIPLKNGINSSYFPISHEMFYTHNMT
jgi:hypothetical protein